VAAAHCVGTDFAGVDVLAHPSGRFYLLEANSPCYFPQAEAFGRVDVARAMVEALLARRASCRIPALSRP
jgi:glutathione synthase/RimK-type ligase-like ATP-grasp enzyme